LKTAIRAKLTDSRNWEVAIDWQSIKKHQPQKIKKIMRQIKIPLLILLMIFGLYSCQKDELNLGVEKNTELNGEVESTGKMVLGDNLKTLTQ